MPIVVDVRPKAEFEQWLAANSKPPKDAAAIAGATDVAAPAPTTAP